MDICAECIGEPNIREWIRARGGEPGCDLCGQDDAPTAPLDELATYMRECLERVWGYAVEQLPYESAEGGYQGQTWDTYDLLFDECQIYLPRDPGHKFAYELCIAVSEEVWCDFDWLSLDEDEALKYSWNRFCDIVKHSKRFFFTAIKQDPDNRDYYAPSTLLREIAKLADAHGLVRVLTAGTIIYRGRPARKKKLTSPADLGPPPANLAIQSNRMNPPGVPMFYAAESRQTAFAELQTFSVYIGEFRLLRDLTILDLGDLPPVPGIFSGAERFDRLASRFLYNFQQDIAKPVKRDKRTHIEYIPTQVVTEYFRHYGVDGKAIDGIRYPSTVDGGGKNIVLFATNKEVEGAAPPEKWATKSDPGPWLRLVGSQHVRGKIRPHRKKTID